MEKGNAKSKAALGFLTVLDHPEHGLFGGYLVLNTSGRPLEFHCTAPIKPNRAQEILYGPTLQPFLFGEQIGQTLLTKAKIEPLVVCTDREPALALDELVEVPVVLVLPPDDAHEDSPETAQTAAHRPSEAESPGRIWRIDAAHLGDPFLTAFRLGRNRLAVPGPGDQQRQLITDRLIELADSFDLAEPFGRIREAIEEARRGGQ